MLYDFLVFLRLNGSCFKKSRNAESPMRNSGGSFFLKCTIIEEPSVQYINIYILMTLILLSYICFCMISLLSINIQVMTNDETVLIEMKEYKQQCRISAMRKMRAGKTGERKQSEWQEQRRFSN
jgi:hypothetical protein